MAAIAAGTELEVHHQYTDIEICGGYNLSCRQRIEQSVADD